jgi:hypothetical protein
LLLEHGAGGSIAGTACNPCGSTEGNQLIVKEILKNIYWRNERILGKAIFAAKCSLMVWYPTNDNYYGTAYLYTLFGDPALRIKYPMNTPVKELNLNIQSKPDNKLSLVVNGILRLTTNEPSELLDMNGRKIIDLKPGDNDLSHLSPSVYFIHQSTKSKIAKVVVTK